MSGGSVAGKWLLERTVTSSAAHKLPIKRASPAGSIIIACRGAKTTAGLTIPTRWLASSAEAPMRHNVPSDWIRRDWGGKFNLNSAARPKLLHLASSRRSFADPMDVAAKPARPTLCVTLLLFVGQPPDDLIRGFHARQLVVP